MLTGNRNIFMTYILPVTLYAFGNRKSPRLPRPSIDIAVNGDLVKPTQPPTRASTFADIRYAPLTGHYYRIEKGTLLPAVLTVIADGKDVGAHSPTHNMHLFFKKSIYN
jgi:hypothetical protein